MYAIIDTKPLQALAKCSCSLLSLHIDSGTAIFSSGVWVCLCVYCLNNIFGIVT